ncbi:MAG: chlorophyll synthesis pathway protein BchC [Pseudomonadota bacterium]
MGDTRHTSDKTLKNADLCADAVVFDGEREARLKQLSIAEPGVQDVVVDIDWAGVSTGTERLFWSGEMPPFPGLGYPLVPGYEAVGRVAWSADPRALGRRVFVPGAQCFEGARGLFGATASRVTAPVQRIAFVDEFERPEEATLLALAATAYHAIAAGEPPDLIIGHGVLGRLLARITIALGAPAPVVWELSPDRADADGYAVIEPEFDGRSDYSSIYDVSGDPTVLDDLIAHAARGAEIVLAGFYVDRPSFAFPPAFMKEIRLRIAAEWAPEDLQAVKRLVAARRLDFAGLISHRRPATEAADAYRTAFEDPACLKMILDWSASA